MKTAKTAVPPLTCARIDTCLPDYFSGDARAWVCTPVWHGMTPAALRRALLSELAQGAVGGNDARTRDDHEQSGAWYRRARAAVRAVKPSNKGARRLFLDLEKRDPDDEYSGDVIAYFVFIDRE